MYAPVHEKQTFFLFSSAMPLSRARVAFSPCFTWLPELLQIFQIPYRAQIESDNGLRRVAVIIPFDSLDCDDPQILRTRKFRRTIVFWFLSRRCRLLVWFIRDRSVSYFGSSVRRFQSICTKSISIITVTFTRNSRVREDGKGAQRCSLFWHTR